MEHLEGKEVSGNGKENSKRQSRLPATSRSKEAGAVGNGGGRRGKARDSIPRSADIARRGVKTSQDLRDLMCAVMTDALLGLIPVPMGNTACRAGDVAIRTFELEQLYGKSNNGKKTFTIASSAIKRQ